MKERDPASPHLDRTSEEKIVYTLYCQHQPDLVEEINALIKIGHSPADIKNFVRLVMPITSQVADHVYLMASYLLRHQISRN